MPTSNKLTLFLLLSLFAMLPACSTPPTPSTYDMAIVEGIEKPARSQGEWKGFVQVKFKLNNRDAWVIRPKKPAPGNPWVWRARFPGFHSDIDVALLNKGFHIAHINTGGMLGSPAAMQQWDIFYGMMLRDFNLAKKPALYGVSRGGLFIYAWAARHPDTVSCIYGDTPVCDFKSWPLGKWKGKGHQATWNGLLKVYDFKDTAEALAWEKNPIDHLVPIARANIPLMHIVSETDMIVPPKENTYVLFEHYRQLGGIATVISVTNGTPKSNGHHFPPQKIDIAKAVEFIEQATRKAN